MKKIGRYIDDAIELFIENIESGTSHGSFGFNLKFGDINNVFNLFDEGQLLRDFGNDPGRGCILLDDGRLFSFVYYYTTDMCNIMFSVKKNINDCTVEEINAQNTFGIKLIQINDHSGEGVIGSFVVPENTNIYRPLNIIMKPVSMEQLYARGTLEYTREECGNDVIYDLAVLLNGQPCSEIIEHDENMEQAGLYKIFDEKQILLTKTESDVETFLARLDDKVIRIVCMPPTSNDGKNRYYMALYSNPEKYMVKPTKLENGRISIKITNSDEESIYSDEEEAFLEIPRCIAEEISLDKLIKPISYEQILERIENVKRK